LCGSQLLLNTGLPLSGRGCTFAVLLEDLARRVGIAGRAIPQHGNSPQRRLDLGRAQVGRAQVCADHVFESAELLRLIWGRGQAMVRQDRADLGLRGALLGGPCPQSTQELARLERVACPLPGQDSGGLFGLLGFAGGQVATGCVPRRQGASGKVARRGVAGGAIKQR
jgi:hypothetical protein